MAVFKNFLMKGTRSKILRKKIVAKGHIFFQSNDFCMFVRTVNFFSFKRGLACVEIVFECQRFVIYCSFSLICSLAVLAYHVFLVLLV